VQLHARLAFTACFALARCSGGAAAPLARAYRALAHRADALGPIVVLVQLPLLLVWAPLRALFLLSHTACFVLTRRLETA
jgi:hypothetical protein